MHAMIAKHAVADAVWKARFMIYSDNSVSIRKLALFVEHKLTQVYVLFNLSDYVSPSV